MRRGRPGVAAGGGRFRSPVAWRAEKKAKGKGTFFCVPGLGLGG